MVNYISERAQNKNERFLQVFFRFTNRSPLKFYTSPFLFEIYICDLTSYADDTTPFSNGANVFLVLNDVKNKASNVFDWFLNSYLKAHPDNSNRLLTSKEETSITIKSCIIKSSTPYKLLCVIIDNKLNFTEHISKLCKKTSQKLHALA